MDQSPSGKFLDFAERADMRLVPLGDKVVVRRIEAEQKSAGGIVLPDNSREKTQQGRVLSVGDGCALANGRRATPQVVEGDRIYFERYAGTEVVVDGEELLILGEHDILAIVA
jgi:chaperonin GroES